MHDEEQASPVSICVLTESVDQVYCHLLAISHQVHVDTIRDFARCLAEVSICSAMSSPWSVSLEIL